MTNVAIKCINFKHGRQIIQYLKSIGGKNTWNLCGNDIGSYYFILNNVIQCSCQLPIGYTSILLDITDDFLVGQTWDCKEEKASILIDAVFENSLLGIKSYYSTTDRGVVVFEDVNMYTKEQLKKIATLRTQVKLTKQEIADKFNIPIKNLKIID